MRMFKHGLAVAVAATIAAGAIPAQAEKKYDPGASDTEIKIGHSTAYSGPASAYGVIGKVIDGYFRKVNEEEGGVNGRKIRFLSLDDGYSPPKTVEVTRQLVEQERVLLIFNTLGTSTNTATHKYLNSRKVPQLFLATGASKWGDPKNYPWTMGWQPDYATEGEIFAKHILENIKDPKIAILSQNDDYGKDYVTGFKRGLGDKAKTLVIAEASYEVTDPTVDSQVIQLKASGANVFFNVTTPKFAAQAIKKAAEIGWKPVHYLNNVSASVGAVMRPAGFANGQGVITAQYLKDPTDAQWQDDKAFQEWKAFMDKYAPGVNQADILTVYGYTAAQTMVETLKRAGDNLTRENVMKQAASLKDLELPMLLPGIKINTGPDDFFPIQCMQLFRFEGETYHTYGNVLCAD